LSAPLQSEDAERLERCLADGGVAVFPTDTVYGLCCDPDNEGAARRMYALKGRPAARACAVMFFSLSDALARLEQLGEGEREVLQALLPGPLTLLLANRAPYFGAACRSDPATLGLRVPHLPEALSALSQVRRPAMQTSANRSGEPDARRLQEVPDDLLQGADLVLDGGELPGVPSTVIDLRDFESEGRWHLLREGAMGRDSVHEMLGSLQPG
jgi:L-threonylcarbamoyladenylate synthase